MEPNRIEFFIVVNVLIVEILHMTPWVNDLNGG